VPEVAVPVDEAEVVGTVGATEVVLAEAPAMENDDGDDDDDVTVCSW
jgi:hypothetical protein